MYNIVKHDTPKRKCVGRVAHGVHQSLVQREGKGSSLWSVVQHPISPFCPDQLTFKSLIFTQTNACILNVICGITHINRRRQNGLSSVTNPTATSQVPTATWAISRLIDQQPTSLAQISVGSVADQQKHEGHRPKHTSAENDNRKATHISAEKHQEKATFSTYCRYAALSHPRTLRCFPRRRSRLRLDRP